MTTYYCVSSLPMPYGIRVTTITWLRTNVWADCPCPTAYTLPLLHNYILLCEQPALALLHMRYYYYNNTYYCVSSLPLPYGIRVTIITLLRTTVWKACPCPTALRVTTITWLRTTVWAACPWLTSYALLLLHDYVLLCEQPALVLLHTRYYYYITTYDCVSSLPLPYGIRSHLIVVTPYAVGQEQAAHTVVRNSSNAYAVGQRQAAHTVVRSNVIVVTRMP